MHRACSTVLRVRTAGCCARGDGQRFHERAIKEHRCPVQAGGDAGGESESRVGGIQKKDKDAYAAFLTDDFQAVEADGDGERSKAKTVREVEHSMFVEYSLQLFQVQQLGPQYAFVTYECTMRFPRGSATLFRRVFIGELWTNRDGDWKMMRYQETVVR